MIHQLFKKDMFIQIEYDLWLYFITVPTIHLCVYQLPIVLESSLQVLGLPKSFVICELVEQSKLKHEKAFSDRLINRNTKGSNKRSKKQSKSGFLLQSQTPKHKEIKRKASNHKLWQYQPGNCLINCRKHKLEAPENQIQVILLSYFFKDSKEV